MNALPAVYADEETAQTAEATPAETAAGSGETAEEADAAVCHCSCCASMISYMAILLWSERMRPMPCNLQDCLKACRMNAISRCSCKHRGSQSPPPLQSPSHLHWSPGGRLCRGSPVRYSSRSQWNPPVVLMQEGRPPQPQRPELRPPASITSSTTVPVPGAERHLHHHAGRLMRSGKAHVRLHPAAPSARSCPNAALLAADAGWRPHCLSSILPLRMRKARASTCCFGYLPLPVD